MSIEKKSVIGPVISVFVMVLVVSILAGLTFLFVAQLKTEVIDTTLTGAGSAINETEVYINSTGYTVDESTALEARGFVITAIWNSSGDSYNETIAITNATISSTGVVTNATEVTYENVSISYTYTYIDEPTAYNAINDTESAGSTIVGYLSLIFLAIIFGAILTLVLKIILPYINLGKQMEAF